MKFSITAFLQENPLYKNSLFVMTSNMVSIGTGFIFWIIAAHLYSTEQIGIATSLYSLLTLLASLSGLGFGSGLLRFLPNGELKNEKINSSVFIVTTASFLVTTTTVIFLPKISPHLAFVTHNPFFFLSFVVFTMVQALNFLTEAMLVALREGSQVLAKNAVLSVAKLIFPFVFLFLGAYGIFSSIEVAVILSVTYAVLILTLLHNVRFRPAFHKASVKQMSYFSFGNYIAGLAATAPTYILPIFITNMLGPAQAAYYYIVGTTSNVLFLIPAVVTQNLLVEGSYNENEIKIHIKKAGKLIAAILIPAIIAMIFLGNFVLLVFGKKYSIEGLHLLQFFALSGIFVAVNYICGTVLNLLRRIKLLVLLNFTSTALILLLTYMFLHLGLIGIGYAMILSQILLSLLYGFVFIRLKLLRYIF